MQSNVEDFLRRGDRGFAAPDASFQLRMDVDSQVNAIRQIAMSDGLGPRAVHTPTQHGAEVSAAAPESSGVTVLATKDRQGVGAGAGGHVSTGAVNAKGSGGGHGEAHPGQEGGENAGTASGWGGRGAGGRAGTAGTSSSAAKVVEKTQIHTFSPGLSGRERSSIITVSSTVSTRAPEPAPSIIGG